DITIVLGSLDETRESAKGFYRAGFRKFKIKIGKEPGFDLARVRAVKELCSRSELYLDANQGYSAGGMLKFLRELKKAGITPALLEQPVPKSDWEGLKEVARKSRVPVCADESASSVADCIRIIREKAVPAVNIKVMKTGMLHSFEIARLCRAHGIRLMIGAMMESSLSTMASAHLASGMGCFRYIDLDTPFFIRPGHDKNPYLSPSGAYRVDRVKAGIGIIPKMIK
ncbi:MAG: enolase C-terminal domain-like protein, partial [Deltaproteobacteria bacterium]